MFLLLSPIHHLGWFTEWFIRLPLLHIHKTSRERHKSSGCVLLLILMDFEHFSRTCSPPTNMWWLSSILLRQQILLSTDPSSAPRLSLYSTCAHIAQKAALCFLDVCSLAERSSCCVVFFHCKKHVLKTNKFHLTPVRLVQTNSTSKEEHFKSNLNQRHVISLHSSLMSAASIRTHKLEFHLRLLWVIISLMIYFISTVVCLIV